MIRFTDFETVEDILTLISLCEKLGYGRVIQIVQLAWEKKALEAHGDKRLALLESRQVCAWCNIDTRTGKEYV